MKIRRLAIMVFMACTVAGSVAGQDGFAKKKILPREYGSLVIDNSSSKAGFPPVLFEHWSHRGKYTCRLCHVDLAFAMKRNASGITAADNKKGYFCGACHNGTRLNGKEPIFPSCTTDLSKDNVQFCDKCHQKARTPREEQQRFVRFSQNLPKARFGNTINWEKAEEMGILKPVDFLEGVSLKMDQLPVQKDFQLQSKSKTGGMPDIIFSHQKHMVWNGCEVCHPDIFAIKKGTTPYSMTAMFEGKYCGVCHDTVAFPQIDCQRCHTKSV